MQQINARARMTGICCPTHSGRSLEADAWAAKNKGKFVRVISGPYPPEARRGGYTCGEPIYEIAPEDARVPSHCDRVFACTHDIEIGD